MVAILMLVVGIAVGYIGHPLIKKLVNRLLGRL